MQGRHLMEVLMMLELIVEYSLRFMKKCQGLVNFRRKKKSIYQKDSITEFALVLAHRINEFENEGIPLDIEIENKEQVANMILHGECIDII
jgi:hypothetical protein